MKRIRISILLLLIGASLSACSSPDMSAAAGRGGDDQTTPPTSTKEFFNTNVKPSLAVCRNCHLPNGIANTSDQPNRRFVLATDAAQDYDALQASWVTLGKGVDTNLLLLKPSVQPHSGGQPWPKGSAGYVSMKTLLSCWESPDSCSLSTGGGSGSASQELLGNPGKHYFVNQICDNGKLPTDTDFYTDSTPIDWTKDPRLFLTNDYQDASGTKLMDSDKYAVHINDAFELCHTETLFKNQAEQNKLRKAKGQSEIYTAKPYAKTCGEWRARVKEGHDWIAMWPTDSSCKRDDINGNLHTCAGGGGSISAWNNLWKVWGLTARPANFDQQIVERYGHSKAPMHIKNNYPIIDQAKGIDERPLLTKTFGGSGRLPMGYAQARDASGKYNGAIGLNCFSCHAGAMGEGEAFGRGGLGPNDTASYGKNPEGTFMGLPNTNTELGVLLVDLINAGTYDQQGVGEILNRSPVKAPAVGYLPIVNTTRGTNAADTEIEYMAATRDFDSLNHTHALTYPLHANQGDQDPPAWWWLHNKSRYLWFGGHSTDSARGNMYFGSVNGLTGDQVKQNEAIFESVHDWSLTVEAPDYPQGYCTGTNDKPGCIDLSKAEAGAILFHEKNLWEAKDASGKLVNADIPKPKGNGACAGCHGVYSPRYANDKRFLPDPKMIGMTGYNVPIEIIDTDPAQTEGWTKELRPHISTFWWSYTDAMPNYLFPENKDQMTELRDDYAFLDGANGANLGDKVSRLFNRTGTLQPLSNGIAQGAGQFGAVPGIPVGQQMGRIKGACGFEEKTVGYVTPPLHGVWASAPYFHNGSVPTVWEVLKPADRKPIWRRKSTVTPDMTVNAFEHRMSGSNGVYDFTNLGFKYDELVCGTGTMGIPYYHCAPEQAKTLPQEVHFVKDLALGGLLWPTWVVPPPVGASGLEDRKIFNTNLYSKKNTGHNFTKALTDAERKVIMEYLKTL